MAKEKKIKEVKVEEPIVTTVKEPEPIETPPIIEEVTEQEPIIEELVEDKTEPIVDTVEKELSQEEKIELLKKTLPEIELKEQPQTTQNITVISEAAAKWQSWLKLHGLSPEAFLLKYPAHPAYKLVEEVVEFNKNSQEKR